jgi:hypothetical protein
MSHVQAHRQNKEHFENIRIPLLSTRRLEEAPLESSDTPTSNNFRRSMQENIFLRVGTFTQQ